jgi:hypothetical protein
VTSTKNMKAVEFAAGFDEKEEVEFKSFLSGQFLKAMMKQMQFMTLRVRLTLFLLRVPFHMEN